MPGPTSGEERDDLGVRRDRASQERDEHAMDRDAEAFERDGFAGERAMNARGLDEATRERLRAAQFRASRDLPDPSMEQLRLAYEVERTEAEGARQGLLDVLDEAENERVESLHDRQASARDRAASEADRTASAEDRLASAEDRRSSAVDREQSAADREQAEIDAAIASPPGKPE